MQPRTTSVVFHSRRGSTGAASRRAKKILGKIEGEILENEQLREASME